MPNVYFVVEGESEYEIYPKWLLHLKPELTQVATFEEIEENNFFIFSSMGYPSIYKEMLNAIEEIRENQKIDYLFVCLDAEETSVKERLEEIQQKINSIEEGLPDKLNIIVIVQDPCIETWLLGNQRLCGAAHTQEFNNCLNFYNVRSQDPEVMKVHTDEQFEDMTRAHFHEYYLKHMLKNKDRRLTYKKGHTTYVCQKSYLDTLITRINSTTHISSFKHFINAIELIKN